MSQFSPVTDFLREREEIFYTYSGPIYVFAFINSIIFEVKSLHSNVIKEIKKWMNEKKLQKCVLYAFFWRFAYKLTLAPHSKGMETGRLLIMSNASNTDTTIANAHNRAFCTKSRISPAWNKYEQKYYIHSVANV